MPPAFPILAIDPGAIVGLIILVLSVLGWLVNLIKGEDNVPKARPRQGNAAGKDLRSEIQDFLDELTVTRNPERPNRRPQRPASEEEVLILEEDQPVRKPVRSAKPEKQRKKGKPEASKAPAAESRSISQVQQQHLPTSRLGSGVQEHIATHMAAGQVTAQAQAFIGHRVEQAVQHDLGTATMAAGAVPALSTAKLHPALTFLTRPGSIRDAIVVSEILQPPKALRQRDH